MVPYQQTIVPTGPSNLSIGEGDINDPFFDVEDFNMADEQVTKRGDR